MQDKGTMMQRRKNARENKSTLLEEEEEKEHNSFQLLSSKRRMVLYVILAILLILSFFIRPSHLNKGKIKPSKLSSEDKKSETPLKVWTLQDLMNELRRLRMPFRANFSESNIFQNKLTFGVTKPVKHSSGKRSFGCMRDTCRGLEIEDLFDRGFFRSFRSALKNDSSHSYLPNLNYRVTIVLLDTTQLNHMKTTAESLFKKIWETQAGHTYVIALEGGDAMGGNKGFQLRNKDRFTRNFGCRYDSLKVQPTQYRLYIKTECEALLERSKNDQTTSFLLKPEAGSQGQGITFHTSAAEVLEKRSEFFPCENRHGIEATSRFLVQEYITHPLLLNKCKFDVRLYLFISSTSPYLLWYHRGYLRRSLTPYSPTTRDRKAYLTNTHFQSSRANFNMSEHIWTFDQMQNQLEKQSSKLGSLVGYVELILEPQIKEIAKFVFESAREKITPRLGSNQIIGLDFMIDENLALHFLEANGYPGFTWSVNFDTRGLVEDMFDLMIEQSEAPGPFRFLRPGDRFGGFQLISSDARPHIKPYNPCEALADNALISSVVKSFSVTQKERNEGSKIKGENNVKEDDDDVNYDKEQDLSQNVDHNNIVESIINYPIRYGTTGPCSNFISEIYSLSQKDSCVALLSKLGKITTTPGPFKYIFQRDDEKILLPSITYLKKHLTSCKDSENGQRTRKNKSIQLLPFREISFTLEKIIYLNGRKPFPVYQNPNQDNKGKEEYNENFIPKSNDPVFVRANLIQNYFTPQQQGLSYRIKWFLWILNSNSFLFIATHEGYAYSVRRVRCGNSKEIQYETQKA